MNRKRHYENPDELRARQVRIDWETEQSDKMRRRYSEPLRQSKSQQKSQTKSTGVTKHERIEK